MNAMLAKLIGSWTLQSLKFTMSDTGEVIEAPMEGVCTFDANGRWTVVTVPADMSGPTNDAERAALFNRTIAFSGPCQFDGNKLTVIPDFASYPC